MHIVHCAKASYHLAARRVTRRRALLLSPYLPTAESSRCTSRPVCDKRNWELQWGGIPLRGGVNRLIPLVHLHRALLLQVDVHLERVLWVRGNG